MPNVFVPLGRRGLGPSDDVEPFASGAPPNYSWWICAPTCGVPVWRRLCLSAGRWHKSWGPTWCSRPAPIHHRGDGGRWFPRQPLLPVSAPGRSVPKCWAHKVTVFFFFFLIFAGWEHNTTERPQQPWHGFFWTLACRPELTDSRSLSFSEVSPLCWSPAALHWFLVCLRNPCSQWDTCAHETLDVLKHRYSVRHESEGWIEMAAWLEAPPAPPGGWSMFANVNFMSFFSCDRNMDVAFEEKTTRVRLEHIVDVTQSHQQGSDSPTSNTDAASRLQRSRVGVSWWLFHLWRLWIETFKGSCWQWLK